MDGRGGVFWFMLQTMKTLLLASLIFVAAAGCGNRSSRTISDAEWDAEYRKRHDAQMEEVERQTRRVTTQQDLQAEQNERFDKLIDRWEKQAKRQEAILDAQEKQLGIKK
jgi:type IV pilus biogenesis protein CpaD/CtpE